MTSFLCEEFLSAEMKKDYFRAYFLESGIIAKLSEALNKLMESDVKPTDPLAMLRTELGDKPIPTETIEDLELELDDAYCEIRRLRHILKKLGVPEAEWEDQTPDDTISTDETTTKVD